MSFQPATTESSSSSSGMKSSDASKINEPLFQLATYMEIDAFYQHSGKLNYMGPLFG